MGQTMERWLSPSPVTVDVELSLAQAHRLMRDHQIRHLPVLDGGLLVGVVSMDDLHLMETFRDVDPEDVPVGDAMSPEPYVVHPEDDLAEVVLTMASRKYGSAIVVERGVVVGIFTSVDALRLLGLLLGEGRKIRAPLGPPRRKVRRAPS